MMRGYGYTYGPTMMGGYSPWFDLMMLFLGLLFVAAIIVLVVWLIRQSARHGTTMMPPSGPPRDEALEIARRRLAAGEITCDQFEEIRKSLGG